MEFIEAAIRGIAALVIITAVLGAAACLMNKSREISEEEDEA